MINFDSLSLKVLISEIEPVLTEGRVQKVQQPSKNEILLTIRALRETHKLYICVDPKYPHVALLSPEGEELRNIEIPQKPPMFCMLLRKHMEGCKINAVSQPGFERIFEIKFDSYNEIGERTPMILSCEFMGKHSNIILYSFETNVIQGCAHPVSQEKSRERELAGGLPYIYPPKQEKFDITKIPRENFIQTAQSIKDPLYVWLNDKFGFISKALAQELCNSVEDNSKLYDLIIETLDLSNINPSISMDKAFYSIIGIDKSIEWERLDSVNSMIDLYFGYQVFNDKFSRFKSFLSGIIKKELKKQKTQLSGYLKAQDSEEKQEKYRQYADIIMANLFRINQNSEFTELENFFDENKIVKIPLDKKLSPNANAQKYYKLYNKAKNASIHAKSLAEKISQEIDYLESIKESINLAENLSDLKEIEQELTSQDIIKSRNSQTSAKTKKENIKLSEFISSDGFSILAGKNNRQNEFLLKIADPEDLWLHAQNIPGSHVLIKTGQTQAEIPETTLHEAVYIAAYYSQGQESSNVPVVYTKRKFVKKPSGSKPGFVIYTHEKTLWVNPDKEKIDKLKREATD